MDKKIDAQAFEAFVQKAFKLTAEELAGLYNEAGEMTDFSLIETKDADRIRKLSTDKTNQYNRGLKEASLKLEREIKEKYEVESELLGIELIDHIIETKLGDVKANDKDVLKHPDVVKLINQHSKEKKALEREWQEKLANKENEVNYANLFSEVKNKGLAEFKAMNPILSEDPKKATAQEEIIVRELDKFKYRKDGDDFIVLKPDGSNYQDEHGHIISYQDHVKLLAGKYFDFKASTDKSGSGNQNSSGGTGGKKVRMPKDKADYVLMMSDNSLKPTERVEIMRLWTSKNK